MSGHDSPSSLADAEKRGIGGKADEAGAYGGTALGDEGIVVTDSNKLHRSLKGRHMQMIAM
jgi:amino acid permease